MATRWCCPACRTSPRTSTSAIAQAGLDAAPTAGYTSQANFRLVRIADLLQQTGRAGTAEYLRHSNARAKSGC
jgi:hypothetical protein